MKIRHRFRLLALALSPKPLKNVSVQVGLKKTQSFGAQSANGQTPGPFTSTGKSERTPTRDEMRTELLAFGVTEELDETMWDALATLSKGQRVQAYATFAQITRIDDVTASLNHLVNAVEELSEVSEHRRKASP